MLFSMRLNPFCYKLPSLRRSTAVNLSKTPSVRHRLYALLKKGNWWFKSTTADQKGKFDMLTPEQQNTIENSIWVVNTALKRQGLQHNTDLKQSAILYMCECLLRFEPEKNIKWTTFAYKNVYLFIKRENLKELKFQKPIANDDISKYEEIIEDKERDCNAPILYERVLGVCTAREKQILELKREGYSHREIGGIIHCSLATVQTNVRKIREKLNNKEKL